MLTEYIFEVISDKNPVILNVTAISKESAIEKLEERYGKEVDFKLLDLRRIIY